MATVVFRGRVFSGLGRGAYYVGLPGFRRRFEELLGYVPYPGTLNLRLNSRGEVKQRARLRETSGMSIAPFVHGGRRLSAVKCFGGGMCGVGVALTIPEITDYDDSVVEVIAPVRLRDALGLSDGQAVSLRLGSELLLHEDSGRQPVSL